MMMPGRVIPFAEPNGNTPMGQIWLQNSVVQIGRDQELLRLRAKVIHNAGFCVHSLVPDELTVHLPKAPGGQVWVFCHTLQDYEPALLATTIRSNRPSAKLLRLAGLHDAEQAQVFFDEWLEPTEGVDELLLAISRLMKQSAATKPR